MGRVSELNWDDISLERALKNKKNLETTYHFFAQNQASKYSRDGNLGCTHFAHCDGKTEQGKTRTSHCADADLTWLASPDEVGFAAAAAHLVCFLTASLGQHTLKTSSLSLPWLNFARTLFSLLNTGQFSGTALEQENNWEGNGSKRGKGTYKTTDGHPVRMRLAAGGALHFEGVVEGVFGGVFGAEVGDPLRIRSAVLVRCGGNARPCRWGELTLRVRRWGIVLAWLLYV